MSEKSRDSDRPDFAQHLEEAAHERRSRLLRASGQSTDWEPEDDTLALSTPPGKEPGPLPNPRRTPPVRPRDNDARLLWMAIGIGAAALVIVLIVAALVYRQGRRVEDLRASIALLEEQLETVVGRGAEASGLQAEIAGLATRLSELERRTALLATAPEPAAGTNGAALEAEVARLGQAVAAIEPRLTRLEQRSRATPPPSRADAAPAAGAQSGGGSWYVVLASLNSRNAAEKLEQSYRGQGVEAGVQTVTVKGKRWFRIRVGPFASQREASRRAVELRRKLGLTSVWLSR